MTHGNIKHGHSRRKGKRTGEYRSWEGMKSRCYNPKDPFYYRYGERGIQVCDRWLESFENFVEDMGPRPEGHTLDRENNSKGYSPGNCRWADAYQQCQSRTTYPPSGVKGVSWDNCGEYYRVSFSYYGKRFRKGGFKTVEEAAEFLELLKSEVSNES